jgi:flagellar hook-associated protein 2
MGSEGAFTLNTSYSMASVASATSSLNSGKAMTLDLTVQGTTHSITVAAGQDTPQGIVTAIDNSGTGALASVDATSQGSADPYSLDITGPSGDSSDFSLSVDYGDGKGPVSVIQPGFTFTASNSANQTAQDAQMSVDGINYTRSSNTVTDVMPGVSMVLNSTTPTGSPATVQLTRDTSSVVSSINSLVQAYNDANNIFNAVQDPTSTAQGYGATLVGDSTALMLQEQLHSMFDGTSSTPGTNIQALWQIGISVDQTGVMSVDSSTLNTALTNNYSDVVMMMTGDQSGLTQYSPESGGIAGDAFKTLSNLTSSSGPLTSETNSADTEISQYQSDMTDLQTRMSDLLTRYQTEFASMNAMVGTINSEKASLSSSLAGLSG